MEALSKRLRELRAGLNITQREMAEKLKVSPASLSSYESGNKLPPLDIAMRMADGLNVSLDWLCGGETPGDELSIKTYADVLSFFVQFADEMYNAIEVLNETVPAYSLVPNLISESEADQFQDFDVETGDITHVATLSSIKFVDYKIANFLKSWQPVLKLYRDEIIDEEVYRAWIDKRVNELKDQKLPKNRRESERNKVSALNRMLMGLDDVSDNLSDVVKFSDGIQPPEQV